MILPKNIAQHWQPSDGDTVHTGGGTYLTGHGLIRKLRSLTGQQLDLPVGIWLGEAEDGGIFTETSHIVVQIPYDEDEDGEDEDANAAEGTLYHKGDDPLGFRQIPRMLTLIAEM